MGREIRRVPKGWVHPKESDAFSQNFGRYKPMYDKDFATVAQEWLDNCIAWANGTHKEFESRPDSKAECPFYWQYDGGPPNPDSYRPSFHGPADCYQIYETVSEGTPVSPVFETKGELVDWLVAQGYSRAAAEGFAEDEYAPSMAIVGGVLYKNIEACALTNKE